jgi:hypothetical protein
LSCVWCMQSVTSRTGHCAHVHANHLVLLGGCPATGHERVSLPRLLKAAAVPEAEPFAPPSTCSRVDAVLTMMARACPPAARCGAPSSAHIYIYLPSASML